MCVRQAPTIVFEAKETDALEKRGIPPTDDSSKCDCDTAPRGVTMSCGILGHVGYRVVWDTIPVRSFALWV